MKTIDLKVKEYLLNKRNLDSSIWSTQADLMEAIPELKFNATSHDNCPELWSIINRLNEEDNLIYLIKDNKYKIASNREECLEYADKYFKKIIPALKRYYRLLSKIQKDGTMDLFTNKVINIFKE